MPGDAEGPAQQLVFLAGHPAVNLFRAEHFLWLHETVEIRFRHQL